MFIRGVLGAILLAGLLYIVDVEELARVFSSLDLRYVAVLVLLSVVMIWISCVKWLVFVHAAGHKASILQLMKYYTIGYFFNVFTPSYVGGDVARSFHLGRQVGNQLDALVSTFLERFTGLLAMALLGVLFVAIGTQATKGVEAAILAVGFIVVCGALVCFVPVLFESFSKLASRTLRAVKLEVIAHKLDSQFIRIAQAMDVVRKDHVLFTKAMCLSFTFHCLTVVNTYVAARAIGWDNPDFAGLFVVVPLVLLVGMAPITPSGLGIQEGAFLFFLQRIGGTQAQGLAVGLVLRAKVILIALVGWLLLISFRGASKECAPS